MHKSFVDPPQLLIRFVPLLSSLLAVAEDLDLVHIAKMRLLLPFSAALASLISGVFAGAGTLTSPASRLV